MVDTSASFNVVIASVLAAGGGAGPAAAAFGPVIAAVGGPVSTPFRFPTDADLRNELTDDPKQWPLAIQRHIEDFVLPRRLAIPATPVLGAPGSSNEPWNMPEKITRVVRRETEVTTFTPPITNALPNSVVDRHDFKLHQLQPNPGHDISNGWQFVQGYLGTTPHAIPAGALQNKGAAVQALKDLAAFEAFCVRLAIAISAASDADASLAETFALWRTEGDLLAPLSDDRRVAGAPTGDKIDRVLLDGPVVSADVLITMGRGLWGITYNKLVTSGPVMHSDSVKNAFKLHAFRHWSLESAGFDAFWQRMAIGDRSATVGRIADLLNAIHMRHSGTSADLRSTFQTRCEAVLDDLVYVAPSSPSGRVLVAPQTPEKLVALMLGAALMFAGLDADSGGGPVVEPTAKLKYLAYHCQDHRHRSNVAQDKFLLMLVSRGRGSARSVRRVAHLPGELCGGHPAATTIHRPW